jgi:hypothetical protein
LFVFIHHNAGPLSIKFQGVAQGQVLQMVEGRPCRLVVLAMTGGAVGKSSRTRPSGSARVKQSDAVSCADFRVLSFTSNRLSYPPPEPDSLSQVMKSHSRRRF